MIRRFMRAAIMAMALGGGVAAGMGGAQAQELRFGVMAGQAPTFQEVQYGRDRWHDHRRDRWRDDRRGGCDARQALRKADRMGVHRARIVDAGRRSVTVAGRDRGGRTFVRFANVRGCPVVGGR